MAEKKENKPIGEDIVKMNKSSVKPRTGRGGTHNFPSKVSAKADDVRRIGASIFRWYNMDKAVTDEEIADRLETYFVTTITEGEMPTVEEMSLALGYDRKTLWEWERGGVGSTPVRSNLIKKAKEFLASFDAKLVQENKVNPTTYIFRAKNYFGLKDEQEYVLTPSNPLGEHTDPNDIKKRLIEGVADE